MMKPCGRCGKQPSGWGLFDYCAECLRDRCGACAEEGCCGHVPMQSGKDADEAAEQAKEEARWHASHPKEGS